MLSAQTAFAQGPSVQKPATHEPDVKKDSVAPKKSGWQVGLTYSNNQVYLGRKDSLNTPYITPSISYHAKSGLFITGSASYLAASGENRIDLVTLEGGYSYSSGDLNAEVSAAKDFFSDASYSVKSEIKARLSASLSYDLGFIEPSLDLGANFSGHPDLGIGLGLEHSFSAIDDRLEINPGAHLNIGTQNYYASYYGKRRYSTKRKAKNPSNVLSATVAHASRLQVMDYEFGLPLEYAVTKKCKINFTPTYALPIHPATVTLTEKSTGNTTTSQTITESLSNAFYFSAGVNYAF